MASVHKEFPVSATPATAWDAMRDFGAVHERVAAGFVVSSVLDGDVRTVRFVNGVIAREELISADDERRRLVYSVIDSPMGLTHHQATVVIEAAGDGAPGSRVVWTTDVLPDDAAARIEEMMTAGAMAIAKTLSD
ncbi:SRPBCC family protein [Nocardioides speluncae]|uniref:SRPBCC family protein n=1 Tax=Nocardioides speluncae TaxID=2670337 RepID=UPI000D69D30F|nr:SRPBCC family protein [Nocardioides speluncae]